VRPFPCALLAAVTFTLPAFAESAAFPYTPPDAPPAPDLFGVLLRLLALTALTLVICGGVIWWARRATKKRLLAGNTDGRLVLEARLPLDARTALHLIRVDGHPVVVTTDASGLKSIVPMQPTFDAALNDAAEPDTSTPAEAEVPPPTPVAG
jgi:hypothetical protein